MADIVETLQAGLEHHRAGRLPQAELAYRRVLEMHPRNAQAMHLLGLVAFQADKHQLAAEYVEGAIKYDAFHAPFWADLAEIYRALERTDDAVAAYRKALKINPDMADAWTHFGTLLEAIGETEEGVACYRRALAIDPNYAGAHAFLGVAMQAQGQLDLAQQSLERAVQLAPENPEIYLQLGRCLHAQQKWLDAIACYQMVRRIEPEHAAATQLYEQARAEIAGKS
jgi:tetratricopeptide (TPR) repeat protein